MVRVGVDLYPEQFGVPLRDVRTFRKMLGGSPTNVAVAAARLGLRSGVITAVGRDGFGEHVRSALEGFGVATDHVGEHPELLTPLAFCEMFPPDDFPLLFYRSPSAPNLMLEQAALDLEAVRAAEVFWTTGTGLSVEPSRSTTLAALETRSGQRHTIHDLDHRPSRARARPGTRDRQARPGGVLAATRDELAVAAPISVEVVNGLGAGDAFGGALCMALHADWPPADALGFANAAGALVASRLGCADDMPDRDEVDDLLRRTTTLACPSTSPLG